MPSNLAKNIKTQIKTDLDALVTSGALAVADYYDFSKDALDDIYQSYPVAIVGLPQLSSSEASDNRDNLRTYDFPILVIQKPENITNPTDFEDLLDAIVAKFDTDYTLGGYAVGGVLPTTSQVLKSTGDKQLLYCVINLKAKTIYQMGT